MSLLSALHSVTCHLSLLFCACTCTCTEVVTRRSPVLSSVRVDLCLAGTMATAGRMVQIPVTGVWVGSPIVLEAKGIYL